MELRSRSLSDTLDLAVAAGRVAGVSRVSDVAQFGVCGIPVFQATRPASRSFTVSQGKGLTPTAAIIGGLLEATEFWTAESLDRPSDDRTLAELGEELGVSRERVRQIEAEALTKLRAAKETRRLKEYLD